MSMGRRYITASASFTGLGDIVPGAIGYWGLRAYSSATRGTAAVRISRPDTTQTDLLTDATTGALITTGAFFTGGPYGIQKV
jgi:hypothetical protein